MSDTVDFDQFHRLYAGIRKRLGRADDLLADTVRDSGAAGTAVCDDGETYDLIVAKFESPFRAVISIRRMETPLTGGEPRQVLCLDAMANLDAREVRVVEQGEEDWTESLIALITPEPSENGQETRNYLDNMVRRQTPAEYNDEREGDGTKAARAILAGIGGLPDLDAYETPHVAQAIVALLKEPAPFGQAVRVERATAWARDPNTQPEWGQFVLASLEKL